MDPTHYMASAMRAIAADKEPSDTRVRELVAAIQNKRGAKASLKYALRKYNSPYQRAVMDALLFGEADYQVIQKATGIPLDAIEAYNTYLFDDTVFEDRLDKIAWVKEKQQTTPEEQHQLLTVVMSVGVDYLVWYLTGEGTISPVRVLQRGMVDATYRSLAHRLAPLNSDTAKHAQSWMKAAAQMAKETHAIAPQDTDDARQQLAIALRHRDETTNVEQSGIMPDEILH